MLDGGPPDVEGAWLVLHRTGLATGGTWVGGRQLLGLLFEEVLDGAFGQPLGGGTGHVLHGRQINIQPGAVGTEGVPGDDFPPLFGESANGIQISDAQAACSHGWLFLELACSMEDEFPSPSIQLPPLRRKVGLGPDRRSEGQLT